MGQNQIQIPKEKTRAKTMLVKIKLFFYIIMCVLFMACNDSEKCENEIFEIENDFKKNKKTYDFILKSFIKDNNSIKKFLKAKINNVRECRDYEEGDYEINFVASDCCDGVIQSINLRYSSNQLATKKNSKIEIKQLDKNWYLVIIKD